ncbi:MAG: hypothetical protein EOO06_20135 [Chitinophagaceae bacterium]|nr:MAG: hypothetical protein EOO06_20135 [Chitinophagaceae bacterium]
MSELLYPNASLVLNTMHIQLADGGTYNTLLNDVNNSKGTFSNNGQTVTWKNVNMQQVLGNMYNKYSQFNLRISQGVFITGGVAQAAVDFAGGIFTIRFQGCELVNQTYNHLLGVCTDTSPAAAIGFGQSSLNSTSVINIIGPNVVSFRKPNNVYCDITLDWASLESVTGKIAQTIGHLAFICDIFPILESKIN